MAEEEKGFVIKDKRTFSPEGGERSAEETEGPKEDKGAGETPEPAEPEPTAGEEAQLPEVNFATFIFSLSSSAHFCFGEIEDPSTGEKKENLPMAKHIIDTLSMLEEKTKGNLTSDEEQLFKNILYDLRMHYVRKTE